MSNKYLTYNLTDFLNDPDFVRWVKTPTNENDLFWKQFSAQFPDKKEVMDEARKAIQNLSEYGKMEQDVTFQDEIWTAINEQIQEGKKEVKIKPMWARYSAVAAVVALICGFGIWFTLNKQAEKNYSVTYNTMKESAKMRLSEVSNTTDQEMNVTLPDGSVILLSQNAKISYSIHDTSANREVFLSGEAFFKVKKDSAHPFFVYTNGLVTRVVGTSFRIKGMDDDSKVSVTVSTGKVLVFSSNSPTNDADEKQEKLLLEPNDKVLYDRSLKKLELTLADAPAVVVSAEELQKYNFANTPVQEIFGAIEKAYHADIEYNEEDFSNCKLTVEISQNSSLFEQLDIISEALGASYTLEKNKIVFSGKPCQ